MGKHSGNSGDTAGTDAGEPFAKLSAEEKGAEFDASLRDPVGYAGRNFGASGPSEQAARDAYGDGTGYKGER